MKNINCVSSNGDRCTHHAAPKPFIGRVWCILAFPAADIRVKVGCRLQTEHPKPNPPPARFAPLKGDPDGNQFS